MHFVIISVNGDSADLFIGDKSALAQMSCVDTQECARIDTGAHMICNASTMCSTLGGNAARRNLHATFPSVCLCSF